MALDFREIRQSEAAECGLVCLAMASGLLGAPLDIAHLRRAHPVSPRGLTLKEITDIAAALNMSGRAVRCDLEELGDLACPAILHWGLNHFVVLERVARGKARIIDPARGPVTLELRDVSKRFTGVALELSATPAFQRLRTRSPLKLASLVRWTPEIRAGLAQSLLLSLVLQAYVVASPFYMQLAIDEAALKGDKDLLTALAIGFGLFAAFNAGAEALRGVVLQRVSALLSWDMTRRLFHHMIRLPLPWFQRRKLADALTRFDSLTPVKSLIANGLVGSVIDGVLSVVTMGMMIAFAPLLALISVAGMLLYVAVRLISIPLNMRLGAASLTASIAEQGVRIETLRAMQTIKVMAVETERESHWANRFAETVKTAQVSAFASIGFVTAQRFFDAITLVVIIYFGARAAIDGKMTIGVLYAFMSYRAQFLARTQSLFEQFIGWRLLDLHTYRLADIALHPQEDNIDRMPATAHQIEGSLDLRGLTFSYAAHERPVFRDVSFAIEPGEFVAIIGPSGAGKSTLLKVICGLYPASAGEVRLDGLPLADWGPRAVRRALGVVMQDDELLSGSIAENVAFFDDRIDMDRVWRCLERAAIAGEIRAMPMRADTLVGDMGSSLSGGQKQRILIARALYREPRILIFDEATSHLDLANERQISETLKNLNITRIVVAHRPETIARADKVYDMQTGRILSRPAAPASLPPAADVSFGTTN
jgi:ATP-binding cassette subfamily B protein RaxB